MQQIKIPNSETGQWEEKEFSSSTQKEKNDQYISFFNRYAQKIQNIENRIEKNEKTEAKNLSRSIETLAVFVTLFTFISLETQILRSGISFLTAVGFSILMLGGLISFLAILHYFISGEEKKIQYSFLIFFVSLLLLATGLWVIFRGEDSFYKGLDERYSSKEQILSIASSTVESSLSKFKNCILSNKSYWPCVNSQ